MSAVYLRYIAELYLEMNKQLYEMHVPPLSIQVKDKLDALKLLLSTNPSHILNTSSVIGYIKKAIKAAKSRHEQLARPRSYAEKRTDLIRRILRLRTEGTHSVKDICSMLKISQSTYYTICKREDFHLWPYIRPKGRQYDENSLQPDEKEYIKHMLDTPLRSCAVPEISAELSERFNRSISRKKVYSYISKTLGYTYKRNTYAAPPAFEPVQHIIQFKVCKQLIDYWQQSKNIMFIDETGFDLSLRKEYSYAKRCQRPYRVGIGKSRRLNVLMAITKENVFGYVARKGSHNEHSFMAFLLAIVSKMHQIGSAYFNNTVIYMDNHRIHTSDLATKLLRILGITTLFSPKAYYQINPIEFLFGIIKLRAKRVSCTEM
jgi:transposase